MCLPNKMSLVKAVTDLLKFEYIPNRVKFSAHDVTARLRELVLQQAVVGAVYPIDVAETGIVMVQGNRVARVEHADVKAVVHHLFDSGELVGYNREDNGTFFEYVPDQVTTMPDPVQADPTPIGPSTGPWSVLP